MKTFFKKFFEAISTVIGAVGLLLLTPFILILLAIFIAVLTIINYIKYKKTSYYKDTKERYSWLCADSAHISFYNDIKKSELPIEYYRDKNIKTAGYGYFVYRDILIIHDFDNVIYFDSEQNEWFIYEEHGENLLKEKVEEEIKKANEFFGENRCNKAIVFVEDEVLDEAPEKYYENIELLRVTGTDEISALNNFIQNQN